MIRKSKNTIEIIVHDPLIHRHQVIITDDFLLDNFVFNEIIDWLQERKADYSLFLKDCSPQEDQYIFNFLDIEIALLFKLTFS